jgi:uncharacterized membrane protein YkvA (DUF1232 family)
MDRTLSTLLNALMLIGVALYVVSPVDLVPGPVDDALLLLFTIAAQTKH